MYLNTKAKDAGEFTGFICQKTQAEGIWLCATRIFLLPIYKMAFLDTDAFRKATGSSISYKDISLPNNDRAAYEEGAWLYHTALLGGKEDIDDIVDAMMKIYKHADDLSDM